MNTASLMHSLLTGRRTDTKVLVKRHSDGDIVILASVKPEKLRAFVELASAGGAAKGLSDSARRAGLTSEQTKSVDEVGFAFYSAARSYLDSGSGNYGWPEEAADRANVG